MLSTMPRLSHIEAEITYGGRLFRLRSGMTGRHSSGSWRGPPGHYGLPGMRERAAQIGAKLNIWSGAGAGTEIELSIPGSIAYGNRRAAPFRLFRRKAG